MLNCENRRARSTQVAVLLEPTPTTIAMRPRACSQARWARSQSSESLRVADSPVVPPTTSPLVPLSMCQSMRRAHAAWSMDPSLLMGVTIATRLPENIEPMDDAGALRASQRV